MQLLTSNAEWQTEASACSVLAMCPDPIHLLRDSGALTAKESVSEPEESGQRVEWNVAARALGVVVWAGKLGAGRGEAAAGSQLLSSAETWTCVHLETC